MEPLHSDSDRREVSAVTSRHSWVKLKVHWYLCRKCGTGKRNAQDLDGGWFTTFHKANGEAVISAHVTACERGKLSDERIEWLEKRQKEKSDG